MINYLIYFEKATVHFVIIVNNIAMYLYEKNKTKYPITHGNYSDSIRAPPS